VLRVLLIMHTLMLWSLVASLPLIPIAAWLDLRETLREEDES
jgi:hypothetical protein